MPVNDEKSARPAKRGDVAGVAISTSLALDHILLALHAIKTRDDEDFDAAVEAIVKKSRELEEQFDRLTGWVKSER